MTRFVFGLRRRGKLIAIGTFTKRDPNLAARELWKLFGRKRVLRRDHLLVVDLTEGAP